MRKLSVTILALIFCTVAAGRAAAQADARITGSVRDQSGALVPGAVVTVKNERTGEERTVKTNDGALFTVAGLRPSTYTVKAAFRDFQPATYDGLLLQTGQDLTIDLELRAAGVTEAVTVTGEAPSIDLGSARMGVNVNQREVSDLPINGRQVSQLYLQAPGAVNSGTGTFGDIRFSGRAVQQNMIRFDGLEGTAIINASPGNLNGEIPSPFRLQSSLENVQEFRVDSNSYPAEIGTGTGGQISVITKSGSNQPHGSAFGYFRDDTFDSKNAFDLEKSPLSLQQFGGSIGGPVAKDRAFFFGSYDGYRLKSGINFIEAVPSAAAFSRAVPAIAPLFAAFRGPGSVVLPGASANPDFDILQLQQNATVDEDSFGGRLDVRLNSNWSAYGRFFRDSGENDQPEGVTGRRALTTAKPSNGVFVLQGIIGASRVNEIKIGYNAAPTQVSGVAPTINGIDLQTMVINISGNVANTGIAGQGSSTGVAIPGGLLRQNSATNGRGAPYDPYSVSFIDNLNWVAGRHALKFGGEARMIRMETDRLGGTTYTWSNINDFLANRLQSVNFLSDVSSASPFNNGATGPRHTQQEYYVAYAHSRFESTSEVRGPRSETRFGVRGSLNPELRRSNGDLTLPKPPRYKWITLAAYGRTYSRFRASRNAPET